MKKRIFSGIQPSGDLHIGHYLGALRNWQAVIEEYDCIFGIVDLHAITVYQEPEKLKEKIRELAGLYIACGIDPKKAHLMVQSSVPGHAELSWLLTCVTPVGWLERMTQYKSKAVTQESVGTGLLTYPVLMAADILIYQASIVPVGEDQSQHLELTRDIANRFNSLYGETFQVPGTKLANFGARVMGLDDPTKKMSKSDPTPGHAVFLLDEPKRIEKKIKRATTDSNPEVDFETMGEGVKNLIGIYQAFEMISDDEAKAKFQGMRYGDLKKTVAECTVAHLEPIQTKYKEIAADPGYLDQVLEEGRAYAEPIAEDTVRTTKERMGVFVRKK
jgi:tryptophanyl-tRNA synthetase